MSKIKDIDHGWKNIKKAALRGGNSVRVGVRGSGSGKNSLASIASYHEKGGKRGRPPKRSFIGSTFDRNKAKYQLALDRVVDRILSGHATKIQGLSAIGDVMTKNIKATIIKGILPKLAISTKKFKAWHGHPKNTPLIFTGRLYRSITHWVTK